jgi:hypothetical protein
MESFEDSYERFGRPRVTHERLWTMEGHSKKHEID